jgi:hypothetical protein
MLVGDEIPMVSFCNLGRRFFTDDKDAMTAGGKKRNISYQRSQLSANTCIRGRMGFW